MSYNHYQGLRKLQNHQYSITILFVLFCFNLLGGSLSLNLTYLPRILSSKYSSSSNPTTTTIGIDSTTLHLFGKRKNSVEFEPEMRAWTCHGQSQKDMVEKLVKAGIVHSKPVKEAFLQVDRANYTPLTNGAYNDAPQAIGNTKQTISAPHMHAHALEEIVPTLMKFSTQMNHQKTTNDHNSKFDSDDNSVNPKELKILDVGCGSGFLTAAFGRLLDRGSNGPIAPLCKGRVYGIDVIPKLVNFSTSNMKKADQDLLLSDTVSLSLGDGWKGKPENAPYHAIHVGAAAASFPKDLMMQLVPEGGVMIIPVGPDGGFQQLYRVERLRHNNEFVERDFDIKSLLGVRYVPLVHGLRP